MTTTPYCNHMVPRETCKDCSPDARPTAPNPGREPKEQVTGGPIGGRIPPMVPLQDDPPKPVSTIQQKMKGCWNDDGSVVLALHLRVATDDKGKTGQFEFEMLALPNIFPDYLKVATVLEEYAKGLRQHAAKTGPKVQLAATIPANLLGKKG